MADIEWTVHGRLQVKESLTNKPTNTTTQNIHDIENAAIKVHGATASGFWKEWATGLTDENGNFSINATKSDKPHFIKIEAVFIDDDLELVFEQGLIEHRNFTIFKSEQKINGPDVDAGTLRFEDGKSLDLGQERGIRTATTWHIVKRAMEKIIDKNPDFAFKKRFKIENHRGGGAKGNAIGRKISLGRKSFEIDVILHEMMHIWDYDHNQGTSNWPLAACIGFNTHNHREFKNIAFHEGFAEYAAWELLHHIWGWDKLLPSTRHILYNRDKQAMHSIDEIEHDDDGVIHGLRLVTATDPGALHLGDAWADQQNSVTRESTDSTRHCPQCPHLMDLWDVLTVFLPNEDRGVSDFWNVTKNKNGLIVFLERAVRMIPSYTQEAHEAMLMLLNPAEYVQPRSLCDRFCSCIQMTISDVTRPINPNHLDRV